MAEKDIMQMICAFVAGSIDKENYAQFKSYVKDGRPLPKGELGELQNVISLIPTMIDLETPDPDIKSKVAEKLLGLKEETKKRIRESTISKSTETTKSTTTKEKFTARKSSTYTAGQDIEVKPVQQTVTSDSRKSTDSVITAQLNQLIQKTKNLEALIWILFSILGILLILAGLYFFTVVKSGDESVSDLRNQLTSLQTEVAGTNEFINEHLSLVEFFNYKNIDIVTLTGTNVSSDSYGRLILSFDAGEGLLQLENLPPLKSNEAYQLWLVSNDASYPLGVFIPTSDTKFFKITSIPYIPREEIDLFRLTIEDKKGAEVPQGTSYLYGILNN
ncbi:anti-sigma factor [Bacteroidota bacterium]